MNYSQRFIILLLKGLLMGTANVIPGVSGGTIALITRIYKPFINSLKRLNFRALLMLLRGRFTLFKDYLNLPFIVPVVIGIVGSVFGLANLFKFLFREYPILIWSLFFGLILASVYYIGRSVKKWNTSSWALFAVGTAISLVFAFLPRVEENHNLIYIFFCGFVSISGMTLPGISGSFLLILMGNYQLLMIKSVAEFHVLYLTVFAVGSLVGLVGFSMLLSWLLKHYHDRVMSTLTGFVLGSLLIIWPWQTPVETTINPDGTEIVLTYARYFPKELNTMNLAGIGCMILGILAIVLLERSAQNSTE